MTRTGLGLAALLGCLALASALPRLLQTARPQRPAPPAAAERRSGSSRAAVAGSWRGIDPNQPRYVGPSRRLAADAIDAIATSGLDTALVKLGHRFLGSPARPLTPAAAPHQERLLLDLSGFDDLSFVEQSLALANSRRVRTRTEAVDRFSDHVRQLRYGGGRVEACARLRQPSLWALAAQRRGYLVDLSPYLPGARQRRVPLQALLNDPAAMPQPSRTHGQVCRLAGRSPLPLTLAELPLAAVPAALPSLRSGDLFVLRGPLADRSPDGIGLVEINRGRLGALLVQPGSGVMRAADLLSVARGRPGITGVAFVRPLPNQDGRPDR